MEIYSRNWIDKITFHTHLNLWVDLETHSKRHREKTAHRRPEKQKGNFKTTHKPGLLGIHSKRKSTGRQAKIRAGKKSSESWSPHPFKWRLRPTVVCFWISPITLHSIPWDCLLLPIPMRCVQISMPLPTLFFGLSSLTYTKHPTWRPGADIISFSELFPYPSHSFVALGLYTWYCTMGRHSQCMRRHSQC